MAKIKTTKKRRGKVQFYLDADIDKLYRANRAQAHKLGVGIDYSDDFNKWFRRENDEIKKQLDERAGEKSSEDKTAAKKENGNG